MHINIDEIKNKKKFLSFNSFRASNPKISFNENLFFSFLDGGVFGNVKLNNPKIKETMETIFIVLINFPFSILSIESHLNK